MIIVWHARKQKLSTQRFLIRLCRGFCVPLRTGEQKIARVNIAGSFCLSNKTVVQSLHLLSVQAMKH